MVEHFPQGNGMVEHFNNFLLQMLRAYAQDQVDWECHLPRMWDMSTLFT